MKAGRVCKGGCGLRAGDDGWCQACRKTPATRRRERRVDQARRLQEAGEHERAAVVMSHLKVRDYRWDDAEYRRNRKAVMAAQTACWLCGSGEQLPGDRWTVDHVVPRSKGGDHSLANLRLAHEECNLFRGDKEVTATLVLALRRARSVSRMSSDL